MKFTDTLKSLEAKATVGSWRVLDSVHPIGDMELVCFLRNHAQEIINLVEAAENMRDCKGRYHTEQATTRVFEALAALNKEQS